MKNITARISGKVTRMMAGVALSLALVSTVPSSKAQNISVVDTIAALQALNTTNTVALVIDYYGVSPQRGRGGGHFRWLTPIPVSMPPTVPDGGHYIASNWTTNGLWERMLEGEVPNVKMWGAKGDGINNDYVAITNAIWATSFWGGAGTATGELLFPAGTYLIDNTLVFHNWLHIRGEGPTTTRVDMQTNVCADIFRTYNADQLYHGLAGVDWDHGLIFENMGLYFRNTLDTNLVTGTYNQTNSALVVCQPGEASAIRNILVGYAGIGIRCMGPGAPGLRLRDVRVDECTLAGVSVEGFTNAYTGEHVLTGDGVSIIGVSGDQHVLGSVTNSTLIRFVNVICGGDISAIKVEGTYGGGIIQWAYPDYTQSGWGVLGHLNVQHADCNCGGYVGTTDFIRLKGGHLGKSGPAFTLSGLNLYNVPLLINDQMTGRQVPSDATGMTQTIARIPINYESTQDGGEGNYSTLTVGQTAFTTLTATNSGWYRVMQPLGEQPLYMGGNLVISSAHSESTELQVDVNPGTGDAWLAVTRAPVLHSTTPVVTKARAYTYWDTTFNGAWAAVDLYFPTNNNPRITLSTDVHGMHWSDLGHTILMGVPMATSNSVPAGVTPIVVNTYR